MDNRVKVGLDTIAYGVKSLRLSCCEEGCKRKHLEIWECLVEVSRLWIKEIYLLLIQNTIYFIVTKKGKLYLLE